jgi:ThiF family protein
VRFDHEGSAGFEFSVAMTTELDRALGGHLHKPRRQEDLAFAYWFPSIGATRYSAVLSRVVWPTQTDRILQGNVAFRAQYLERVLAEAPPGAGIAFMHGHLTAGWQPMSADDVTAEHDRIAGQVAGRTGLPLVGLTRGTDGSWSARFWARTGPRKYERLDARSVRVVGPNLVMTFHPSDQPPGTTSALGETATVWGKPAHADLVRCRLGIVGLGSVGSLAAEAASRMGMGRLTYVDHDILEMRNLDRTHGATVPDVVAGLTKVAVAGRATAASHTAPEIDLRLVARSLLSEDGYRAALDCDVLLSCVDRPLPRWVLNGIAYGHLIPVVDGGIFARVTPEGTPLHVDWRIQAVGPERPCLLCVGALRRSDVALDREGKLDDPEYIAGLPEAERGAISRRNVFPFSMSVAAHQVLQAVGIATSEPRIGGRGSQMYHAYPGNMDVDLTTACEIDCEFPALASTAPDLRTNWS